MHLKNLISGFNLFNHFYIFYRIFKAFYVFWFCLCFFLFFSLFHMLEFQCLFIDGSLLQPLKGLRGELVPRRAESSIKLCSSNPFLKMLMEMISPCWFLSEHIQIAELFTVQCDNQFVICDQTQTTPSINLLMSG